MIKYIYSVTRENDLYQHLSIFNPYSIFNIRFYNAFDGYSSGILVENGLKNNLRFF